MKKAFALMAALALLGLGIAAQANVFNLGTGFTNLETVRVGDPGNAGELSGGGGGGYGSFRICGSVGYNYNIGKYEVTAKQYTDFLNNKAKSDSYGLYNPNMVPGNHPNYPHGCNIVRSGSSGDYTYAVAADWANRPVNYVSYWDACRFANWLHNGQGNGDTENGAYTLNSYNGTDGRTIGRNSAARWAVTSEDEWYKAAYYKGGGTNAGYWDYPTRSNTAPGNQILPTDPGNQANYYWTGFALGSPYYRTNVGEFENSASPYGTFDQGGNLWEWNETVYRTWEGSAPRGIRGGSFDANQDWHRAVQRSDSMPDPAWEDYNTGFRVAYTPEPSSVLALFGGLISLFGMRRRRA